MKYSELSLGEIEAIVDKLGGIKGVQRFLSGNVSIIVEDYLIDCDVIPSIGGDWKIEEHIKGGKIIWDSDKFKTYLCDEQKMNPLEGNKIREKLKDRLVLNACILEYLLNNPEVIPKKWKGKNIVFWGTIYRNPYDLLCVFYLFWDNSSNSWKLGRGSLNETWDNKSPAVVLCK